MLTHQQRKALLFIEAHMEVAGGAAPTIREIASHMRYRSPCYAHKLVLGLEERGFLRRVPGARGIELAGRSERYEAHRFNPETKELEPMPARTKNPEG